MNKMQLPQSKLLYAVSELYRLRKVDETQKRQLKEKIITDNVEIYELLEQIEHEPQLLDALVGLVRVEEEPKEPSAEQAQVMASAYEEASSPYGEFLRMKKLKQQNKHKKEVDAIKERGSFNIQATE